ncbi:hypothetical protein NEUTE1DRAFT_59840 [Neurospora tetrasperma FGSC 2508]|uniref:Cell wall protein n=1 Tax=Neurospora tetrasperma (strain FGSC 2508 / ATCC MYA-4615 / P0657) TaxID=510951 RepID=F8MIE8_NEUT8|nr:uncharacterized protein NEUTE1DRAFT_59840 [Neurospora tetrasperma FGSC 2508]EGO58952.1 hypothetical protein NEUTE1DRAFT_59840 [Neurospora tetrasperma FGSC 2508]
MKYNASLLALAVATVASARELSYQSFTKREVPQEHSYDAILRGTNAALKLNNPLNIQDAVFGLLDNAAAAKGAGQVTNLDCLQQIVADQAFTNAKAAGDLDGQVNAVLFRALERETSQVGLASAICDETAKNPEIAVVHQHQDPASAEGKAKNKDIELVVAKVLKGLGADPLLALDSATSLPGDDDGTADDTGSDAGDDDTCEDDGTPDNTGDDAGDDDTCEDDGTPDDAGDDAGDDDTCEDDGTNDDNTGATVSPKATTGNATGNNNTGGNISPKATTGNATGNNNTGGAASPTAATGNGTGNTNTSGAVNPTATTGNGTGNTNTSGAVYPTATTGNDTSDDDTCEDDGNTKTTVRRKASKLGRRHGGLDFGSCGTPQIQFAKGLDGREEESFQPVNGQDFDHESALNIQVISEFVCQKLQDDCNASIEAVAACKQASSAASTAEGQQAAFLFNAALGV